LALVWVGEPWLLPDARVAAPIIARGEAGADAWSVVVMTSHGDRYVIGAVLAFDARNQSSPFTHRNPLTSSDLPG
jgi:hypothetical protein